jgi:ATP synthase protein I
MSLIGPEGRKQLQLAAGFLAAGLELAVAIVLGFFGGRLLDGVLGTAPYLAFVGLFLGIAAGFRNLFALAKKAQKQAQSANPDLPPTSQPPDDPTA